MNRTLLLAFLRQRFTSPARLLLMFLIFTGPLAMTAATRGGLGFQPLGMATLYAFVLGAGMIGGDGSSGVFQLLFARPVTRLSYLLSRWFAVGAGAAALSAAQLALAGLILTANGTADWMQVGRFFGEQALEAFALAAVIAAFSSLLPGIGDVVAMFAAGVALQVLQGASLWARQGWLGSVVAELQRTLGPEASGLLTGSGDWRGFVALFSSLAIGLAVAAFALSRREISYAND